MIKILEAVFIVLVALVADLAVTSVGTYAILALLGLLDFASWNVFLAVYIAMWMVRLHVNASSFGGGKK